MAMIGLAGEGGGRGHRNFLPGVVAGEGEGAISAGRGLENGLAVAEEGGAEIAMVLLLWTSETLLLQEWPMASSRWKQENDEALKMGEL